MTTIFTVHRWWLVSLLLAAASGCDQTPGPGRWLPVVVPRDQVEQDDDDGNPFTHANPFVGPSPKPKPTGVTLYSRFSFDTQTGQWHPAN